MTKLINFIKKIVLFFLFFFIVFSLTKNIFDYKNKISFFQQLKSEFVNETEKNKKLKAELAKTNDYYYLEKNIREKLNLVKPNEIVVILPKTEPQKVKNKETIRKPTYTQWLELFLNY